MNKFEQLGFLTQSTKDYAVDSRFDDLREFLENEFNGDYQAMLDCYDDFMKMLNDEDSDAENGNHKWSEIESKMNSIAFDGQEWLYYQNNPVIEIDRKNA